MSKKFKAAKYPAIDPNEPLGVAYEIVSKFYKNCGNSDYEISLTLKVLEHCIDGGIKFGVRDFHELMQPRSWYAPKYMLVDSEEQLYWKACQRRDKSAAISIEAKMNRIPWRANGERVAIDSRITHVSNSSRDFKVTVITNEFIRMKSFVPGKWDFDARKYSPDTEVKLHKMTEEEFWNWGLGAVKVDSREIGTKAKDEGRAHVLEIVKDPVTGEVSKETYDASGIDKVVDDEGNKEEQQA